MLLFSEVLKVVEDAIGTIETGVNESDELVLEVNSVESWVLDPEDTIDKADSSTVTEARIETLLAV